MAFEKMMNTAFDRLFGIKDTEKTVNESKKTSGKKPLKESYYKDCGSGLCEPGEICSDADLRKYWDENKDSDYCLMQYDSYDDWARDTKENYLEPVNESKMNESDEKIHEWYVGDDESGRMF